MVEAFNTVLAILLTTSEHCIYHTDYSHSLPD